MTKEDINSGVDSVETPHKLTVEDFSEASKMSPADFDSKTSSGEPSQFRQSSVSQLAAYEVLKEEFPTKESFRAAREMLATDQGRVAFMERRKVARDTAQQEMRKDVENLLADPDVPNAVKYESIDALNVGVEEKPDMDQYSEASLVAESDLDETEEAADGRMSMIDSIANVNKQKRLLQKAINGLVSEEATRTGMAVDIAELMVPFAEWIHVDELQREIIDGDANSYLLGSQKEAIYQKFESMPLDKKVEFSQAIIDVVTRNEDIIFSDGNELMKIDMLRNMLLDNEYSATEKWFDNITSVLDVIGVGATVRSIAKSGKVTSLVSSISGANKASKSVGDIVPIVEEARALSTQTKVSPTSPVQNAADTNPQQARNMHLLLTADETGEASKALTGTDRTEAIVKAELPDAEIVDGVMPNKVKMEGPQFTEPTEIRAARTRDGASYLSEAEVAGVRTKVIAGLEDVEGMNIHKNSMSIKTDKGGVFSITARYSPRDSGFKSAARAIENAEYAFRHYGLTAEDFVLYERVGSNLVETTQADLKAKALLREGFTKAKKAIPEELKTIDYVVGVRHDYGVRPQDIEIYDTLTVKRNWLDRGTLGIGKANQGSITQHLLDASSVLHPQIVEPASVAVDRGVALKKAYIELTQDFSKSYAKLPKLRRAAMTDYINEANEKGIRFDLTELLARGFSTGEIEALAEWRRANDIMYHAMNADMAKTMRNKGFQTLIHKDSDTHLYVKPLGRGAVNNGVTVYDPTTNKMLVMSTDEIDDLYSMNGGVARLQEPVKVDGVWVDRVIQNDTPSGGYLRPIKDGDTVMAYRDGYYPVLYDAEFFIQKQIRVAGGEIRTKTVASAKTKVEMRRALERLQELEPDTVYTSVKDRRRKSEKANSFDENGWSLAQSSGLSAQKVRGERLVDAGVDLEKAGRTNLVDPLEAISAQIESLSKRVSMRNYLDTTKQRWLDNYADKLDIPKDKYGEVQFPTNVDQIEGLGTTNSKVVGDARTLFNHLRALEDGYLNTIDESYKAMLHFGADMMSDMGFGAGDKALRGMTKGSGITSKAKGAAFKLYLAANPLRQIVIQSHQAIQLIPLNPTYMLKPDGMTNDLSRILLAKAGLAGKDKGATEMWEQLKRSGLLDAVDENNLVRGEAKRLADLTASQKSKSLLGKPFDISQKLGFDKGEQFVMITSWLAHRDMALKAGKTLNTRGLDEVAGKARAFTYNMNRAGDMPYNQNTLNVVAQFLQVPHKAMLQMFTNRSLTRVQRGKLAAWNTVMYGLPAGAFSSWLYNNVEEGSVRDVLEHGLEDVALNASLSKLTGVEQQVDWGDLAPTNAYGLKDFAFNLFTTDIGTLLADSPSGALFFGGNPRLTSAFSTALRWANVIDDYDDPELDTKYTDVTIAFAETMSGMSNSFKTAYALKNRQKRSSTGNITDSDITAAEAALQSFGFQTRTESGVREANEKLYEGSTYTASDVGVWYSAVKRHLTRRGDTPMSEDLSSRVLAEGLRVFNDDRFKFQKELIRLINNDAKSGDDKVIEGILRKVGIMTNEDLRAIINTLPKSDTRDQLNTWIDNVERAGE